MGKAGGVGLPVLAVEFYDAQAFGLLLQAAQVDIHPIGIGARNIKGLNTANAAKLVLRHTAVELVGGQVLLTRQ